MTGLLSVITMEYLLVLTKSKEVCKIILLAGLLAGWQKKFFRKSKKTLDKFPDEWYNGYSKTKLTSQWLDIYGGASTFCTPKKSKGVVIL